MSSYFVPAIIALFIVIFLMAFLDRQEFKKRRERIRIEISSSKTFEEAHQDAVDKVEQRRSEEV